MKEGELGLRLKFLVKSRESLIRRLRQVKEEFRIEVERIGNEIATARVLRGEGVEPSPEDQGLAGEEGTEPDRGRGDRLGQSAKEESEAIRELTYRATLHPEKGRRVRGLLAEIEMLEGRIKRLEAEISRSEELLGRERR